jgi:hypothetical protein
MDRREAIKKLGAAGVVVAGGSMVLSSNNVAFAASADTCLTGIPGPSAPLPLTYRVSRGGTRLNISVNVTAKCNCTNPVRNATSTYSWDASPTYTLVPPNTPSGPAGYRVVRQGNVSSRNSSLLRKNPNGTNGTWVNGDKYSLNIKVTWKCTNAPKRVEATYKVSGTYPSAPTGAVLTYATV